MPPQIENNPVNIQPKKKIPKWVWVLVGIVLVVVYMFLAVSFHFWPVNCGLGGGRDSIFSGCRQNPFPNQDAMADWKTYTNADYGFQLTLTDSWKGYSVVADKWQGTSVDNGNVTETGPKITLRHPNWDSNKEEIPIMVLTPAQWDLIVQEKLAVGAAPIPPTKLGQNDKYIFALPARYNFGFNSEEAYTDAANIVATFKIISASTQTTNTNNSGIKGKVTIGPTCPVQRIPPDPQCADRTYQAGFNVKDLSGRIVKSFSSDAGGMFSVSLPPGNYNIINTSPRATPPTFRPQSVTITANNYTQINLQFDSGIR